MLEKCPVCSGRGLVAWGFYGYDTAESTQATTPFPEKCRSCDGRGYIYIKEMISYPCYGVPKTTGGRL